MCWIAITLVFVTSVCYANHCPDPGLQQAVIGGDTIDGSVRLHHKPLKFAQLRLFFFQMASPLGSGPRTRMADSTSDSFGPTPIVSTYEDGEVRRSASAQN